jgi:hypothetical protein
VDVHRDPGSRDSEHDVIPVEQLRHRRFDGEPPVVAAVVGQRRQRRDQRVLEPREIYMPQRQVRVARPSISVPITAASIALAA